MGNSFYTIPETGSYLNHGYSSSSSVTLPTGQFNLIPPSQPSISSIDASAQNLPLHIPQAAHFTQPTYNSPTEIYAPMTPITATRSYQQSQRAIRALPSLPQTSEMTPLSLGRDEAMSIKTGDLPAPFLHDSLNHLADLIKEIKALQQTMEHEPQNGAEIRIRVQLKYHATRAFKDQYLFMPAASNALGGARVKRGRTRKLSAAVRENAAYMRYIRPPCSGCKMMKLRVCSNVYHVRNRLTEILVRL
jgi:hypothetical protein